MLGPILIHQREQFSSYYSLPSTMIRYEPDLRRILAFGTGKEVPLYSAFKSALPFAVHLLCDMHMKDSISLKLSELDIRGPLARQYMTEIFGNGQQRGQRLVDRSTEAEFSERMENLKEGWTTRHKEGGKFCTYFTDKKAPKILSCMSSTVRSMSGLGFPPDLNCQNANECMNSVVKRGAKNKMDIADCVEHLRREKFCTNKTQRNWP